MRTKISTTITFEFDRPEQTSIPTKMLEEIAYSSQPLSLSQKEALSRLLPPLPKPVVFFEGQKVKIKEGAAAEYLGRNYRRKENPDQIFILYRIEHKENLGYDHIAVLLRKLDKDTHICKYVGSQSNLINVLEPVEELFGEILQKISPTAPVTETGWITWNPFSEAAPPKLPDEKHAFLLRRRDGTVLDYNPEEEEFVLDDSEDSLWKPRNFPNKDIVEYKIVNAETPAAD
jgi:hypothetical protein